MIRGDRRGVTVMAPRARLRTTLIRKKEGHQMNMTTISMRPDLRAA